MQLHIKLLSLAVVGASASASSSVLHKQEEDAQALIDEYNDASMGIAFTMVGKNGWESGLWGLVDEPMAFDHKLQTCVSIMTYEQPMAVYINRPMGLALHVTEESGFWKNFQVIGHGHKAGNIVGGPHDGGSHTPGTADYCLSPESTGKDYQWFTSQKNKILGEYNTLYGNDPNHGWNEFDVNGLLKSALAGFLKFTKSNQAAPTDADMCKFLTMNSFNGGQWPIYAYSETSLKIDGYLDCSAEPPSPGPSPSPLSPVPSLFLASRRPSPPPPSPPTQAGAKALIDEYNDASMGIAFTMVSDHGWESGLWGLVDGPMEFESKLQTCLSIMTYEQPMAVYINRPMGLALHVTEESGFWKNFQVIGHHVLTGKYPSGNIVGGPGDGGSHTPPTPDWRLSVQSTGKDYQWFTSQKNKILANYNTVHGNHDWNEFDTNGLLKSAVAGFLKFTKSNQPAPTDADMCKFLAMNSFSDGPWPIYAYSETSLEIERYLDCTDTILI